MVWEAFVEPNITNYVDMFNYTSLISSDTMGIGIILSTFAIILISYRRLDLEGIAVSSFVSFMLSILLSVAGLLSMIYVSTIGVVVVVSTILIFIQKRTTSA